jgi:hypothetical protein
MRWVRFVTPCTICGTNRMEGDVVLVPAPTARELVRMGRAVRCARPAGRRA